LGRLVIRSAGRKELPNPISETHAQHHRREQLEKVVLEVEGAP
jgi:hypothetical protein